MVSAEVVTDAVPFGEGPVWCPDRTIVCVSVSHGDVRRVDPSTGTVEVLAETAGGPNAAVLATDGSFVVTQNGGIDFVNLGHMKEGVAPPLRPMTPGIQQAWPNGRVAYLSTEPMLAPNDLVVARDGTIYFTDPGCFPPVRDRVARIMAMDTDLTFRVVADGFRYVNGIAIDPDGTSLVVIEDEGLLRIPNLGRGERQWVVRRLGPAGGDGFAIDVDGRYYVASKSANGIRVLETDGSEVEFLGLGGEGFVTNCCFGGDDLRTIFATEARGNRMVVWEGMPTAGLAMHEWPAKGT
jgi:gluconolactonase